MRLKSELVRHSITDRLSQLSGYRPFALLCLLAYLCLAAGSFAQAPQASQKPDANAPSAAQPAASPDSAAAPEPAPSGLPTVTFQNGQLTIVAFNATLHDVLDMVRSQTGATIDIPPEANERVFVRLGPGPVRSVLDSLLAGSQFNFIILGSVTDPNALSKVVLSVKTNSAPEKEVPTKAVQAFPYRTEAASARPQEPVQPVPQAEESAPAKDAAANPAAKPEDAAKQDNAGKADTVAKQDSGAAPDTAVDKTDAATATQPADASAEDYPHTPNIKSAQEILQDLYDRRRQAMERQQQQQSQQQPPPQQ